MGGKPAPEPDFVLRGHHSDVHSLLYHPFQPLLYSGDAGGEVKVWDLLQRRTISSQRLHEPEAGVVCLRLACSGKLLLSQGRDGVVKSWPVSDNGTLASEPHQVICTGSYNFCRFALHAAAAAGQQPQHSTHGVTSAEVDNRKSRDTHCSDVIAVAGSDPSISEIWDMQTGTRRLQLKQPEGQMKCGMCMAVQLFCPVHNASLLYCAAGYEDGTVAIWVLNQPAAPLMQLRLHSEPIMCLSVDSQGTGGVSGSADDKVVSFSLDFEQRCMRIKNTGTLPKPGIGDLATRPDDKIIACGGWDGKLRVYQYKKLKPLAVMQFHQAAIASVCFNQTDFSFASGSRDGTIAVWSVFAA